MTKGFDGFSIACRRFTNLWKVRKVQGRGGDRCSSDLFDCTTYTARGESNATVEKKGDQNTDTHARRDAQQTKKPTSQATRGPSLTHSTDASAFPGFVTHNIKVRQEKYTEVPVMTDQPCMKPTQLDATDNGGWKEDQRKKGGREGKFVMSHGPLKTWSFKLHDLFQGDNYSNFKFISQGNENNQHQLNHQKGESSKGLKPNTTGVKINMDSSKLFQILATLRLLWSLMAVIEKESAPIQPREHCNIKQAFSQTFTMKLAMWNIRGLVCSPAEHE